MWDPPSDMELAPGKPGKPSLARRMRDQSVALAARASGAPWLNVASHEVIITHFGSGRHKTLRGTWEVPADVYWIHVLAVGGGGAGGSYPLGTPFGYGGGGGAGGVCERTIPVYPGQDLPITIGAGGYPHGYVIYPGGSRPVADPTVDTTLDNFQPGDGSRTTVGEPPHHVLALGGKRGSALGDGGAGGSGEPYSVVVGGQEIVVPRIPGASGEDAVPIFGASQRSGRGADGLFGGGGRERDLNAADTRTQIHGTGPGAGGAGGMGVLGNSPDKELRRLGGMGHNGIVIIRY